MYMQAIMLFTFWWHRIHNFFLISFLILWMTLALKAHNPTFREQIYPDYPQQRQCGTDHWPVRWTGSKVILAAALSIWGNVSGFFWGGRTLGQAIAPLKRPVGLRNNNTKGYNMMKTTWKHLNIVIMWYRIISGWTIGPLYRFVIIINHLILK